MKHRLIKWNSWKVQAIPVILISVKSPEFSSIVRGTKTK